MINHYQARFHYNKVSDIIHGIYAVLGEIGQEDDVPRDIVNLFLVVGNDLSDSMARLKEYINQNVDEYESSLPRGELANELECPKYPMPWDKLGNANVVRD